MEGGTRTPELIFSAVKINEAVPRPKFFDGKILSRGRVLYPPPAIILNLNLFFS